MREYIEHDGVITNEKKNEVIHRFDVGVVRKTPPDAEKSVENMSFMFYDLRGINKLIDPSCA